MKAIAAFIFILSNFISFGQENEIVKPDTIRKQGYLIVKGDAGDGGGDISRQYIFMPMEKMKGDLCTSYTENILPTHKEVYLTIPYIIYINSMVHINTVVKMFINPNYQFADNTIKGYDFYKKATTVFECDGVSYQILFIDGTWVKMQVERKNINLIEDRFNTMSLSQDEKVYDFYFLTGINILSTELSIKTDDK